MRLTLINMWDEDKGDGSESVIDELMNFLRQLDIIDEKTWETTRVLTGDMRTMLRGYKALTDPK